MSCGHFNLWLEWMPRAWLWASHSVCMPRTWAPGTEVQNMGNGSRFSLLSRIGLQYLSAAVENRSSLGLDEVL
ncbi:hypothetical protein DFP72DRAFT_877503, partial [Ephemerocybe angulata]